MESRPHIDLPTGSPWSGPLFLRRNPFGKPKAAITLLKAAVSSSTRKSSSSFNCCPCTAQSLKNSSCSSQPRLPAERLATIPPNDAPSAPIRAATDPPPGAGESLSVSLQNWRRFIFTSDFSGRLRDLEFDHFFLRIERLQLAQAHRANREIDQLFLRRALRPFLFAEKIFPGLDEGFLRQHPDDFRAGRAHPALRGGDRHRRRKRRATASLRCSSGSSKPAPSRIPRHTSRWL